MNPNFDDGDTCAIDWHHRMDIWRLWRDYSKMNVWIQADQDNYAIRWASRMDIWQLWRDCSKISVWIQVHDDNYAIQLASENGHLEVVERLLQDERVDPSADNNYAIQ